MKTFVSLSVDYDHPNESGVVVFQAESEKDAVLQIVKNNFDESDEEAFEIGDIDDIDLYMYDDFPVMIGELKGGLLRYEEAMSIEFEEYHSSCIFNLLEEISKK